MADTTSTEKRPDAKYRRLNKPGNPNPNIDQVALVHALDCGDYAVRIRYSHKQGLELEHDFTTCKYGDLAEAKAQRTADKINQKGQIEMKHWVKVSGKWLDKPGWAPQTLKTTEEKA
jgi:hypothetical protein